MKNSVDKTFKKLLIFSILYTAFVLINIVCNIIGKFEMSLNWILHALVMAIICFGLAFSYRSHNKNVMKPLLGAGLTVFLICNALWISSYIQYEKIYHEYYGKAWTYFFVVEIVLMFVSIMINVMHYVINADHHSNPEKIKINRNLIVVYVCAIFAQTLTSFTLEGYLFYAIAEFFACASDIFLLLTIFTIESSLDEFRLAREGKADDAAFEENAENIKVEGVQPCEAEKLEAKLGK